MKPAMPPERLLAELEKRLAQHREREALHSEKESLHREQREHHAREAAKIAQTVDALRASLTAAFGLVTTELAGETRDEPLDTGHVRILSRLVRRVIEDRLPAERFGAKWVTEEVNRRFSSILRRPATERQVAMVLRRQALRRKIHQVRRGRPHHEALYVRERPAGS